MSWNANNDLVRSDDVLFYITSANTVLAYATSVSLQTESESLDTSSKFSCEWASRLGGRKSYTINVDALYCSASSGADFDDLLGYMISGDQVDWVIGTPSAYTGDCADNTFALGTTLYKGKAVVTSVSLEASNGDIATCSATLEGAGPLQIGS